MNLRTIIAVAAFSLVSPARPAWSQQPAAPSGKQPEAARPQVYDEEADAKADIATAIAKAKKDNKRVLIQWGANWCGWCVKLHGTMKSDKVIAKELSNEYEVVRVDVGRFDRHMDLADSYGAKLKGNGIPYLTVLDADGKVVANQETGALEKGEAHDTGKVLAFLETNQVKVPAADDLLATALSAAKSQDKTVFVHFGAPWCGWCRRLEGWMAQPEVAAILAKDFVDCKVDTERNPGGGAMLKKYNALATKPAGGGIPWMVFLDSDGKTVADSNGPKGNTGFPSEDHEIAHFVTMLRKARKHMTEEDIAALQKSLTAASKKAGG